MSPLPVSSYIGKLHIVYYRLAPDRCWSWLRDIVNHLHLKSGMRHIRPDRLKPIDELFRAGMGSMNRTEAEGPEVRLRDSVLYHGGLMIALLACTLRRPKYFAWLEFGGNLIRQSDDHLPIIPAYEVKIRQ